MPETAKIDAFPFRNCFFLNVTSTLAFRHGNCLVSAMVRIFPSRTRPAIAPLLLICSLTTFAFPVAKPHVIAFGKWISVPWSPGSDASDDKPLALKVRPLMVDARTKEFTLGAAHEITDRLFVVRRAFRVNDSLPSESTAAPHWQWQRGGWLLVDRVTARISPINLPEFDGFYSSARWYRDYAAYCGVSEDGRKIYAVVAQIGRRKPVVKKILNSEPAPEAKEASPDSACPAPAWQHSPARVTFEPATVERQTFAIRGHLVDLITEEDESEEAEK